MAAASLLLVHRANRMAADEPIAPTSEDFVRLLIAFGIVAGFLIIGLTLALLSVILPWRRQAKSIAVAG
jgi:hypothetical protein